MKRAGGLILCCALAAASGPANAQPFDWPNLKKAWRSRIAEVAKSRRLPLLDIESNYRDLALNPGPFAREMDANGVALIALSPELEERDRLDPHAAWPRSLRSLIAARPRYFIPVPTGHLKSARAWGLDPFAFLDGLFARVLRDGYPMMGEFSAAEYLSPWLLGAAATRENPEVAGFPIDGALGERIFAFSQAHDVPFQLHLEVEDDLLAALEGMLDKYPRARVVWCHVGRVRYPARAARYGADYLRALMAKHPNLYFTLAGSDFDQFYPPTNEFCSVLWDRKTGHLKPEWSRLIAENPWRFLVGFNLNSSRMTTLRACAAQQRRLLGELPPEVREIVAYKAAWKLLFREEL
ncbi:MAG: amidohydrolase family protein [Elusimicrobia bacterium]|nr:amidohydrolase family protein [Elusimicrobiota bacterium]